MPPRPLTRLRKLCLALPEAHEVEAWGEPTFRVKNKLFAMYADAGNHHGGGRPAVWLKAAPGNQPLMVRAAPDRYFVPPYVGPSGWVGVWLDQGVDWDDVADLLRDAWGLTAPKKLLATVEFRSSDISGVNPAARRPSVHSPAGSSPRARPSTASVRRATPPRSARSQ